MVAYRFKYNRHHRDQTPRKGVKKSDNDTLRITLPTILERKTGTVIPHSPKMGGGGLNFPSIMSKKVVFLSRELESQIYSLL